MFKMLSGVIGNRILLPSILLEGEGHSLPSLSPHFPVPHNVGDVPWLFLLLLE